MKNYMYAKDNIIGFGLNPKDQITDWNINKLCKLSVAELPMEYRLIYSRQSPWMPYDNMLQITGIDCIQYKCPMLVSHKTRKRVVVNKFGRTIYLYLMDLLGDSVTYEQIRIVLHNVIETLFHNISTNFIKLDEYNSVFVCDKDIFIDAECHEYEDYVIAIKDDLVGLLLNNKDAYYALNRQDDLEADICYLAYRAGVKYQLL